MGLGLWAEEQFWRLGSHCSKPEGPTAFLKHPGHWVRSREQRAVENRLSFQSGLELREIYLPLAPKCWD